MERFDGLRPARLKVGIISAGRVGTALGVALQRADHVVVACSAISHASRRRAQRRLPDTPVLPPLDVAASAELLLLAVTDSELAGLVSGLAATSAVRPQTIVAHTSGANGIGILAPLAQQGCIPLAIHPAMTFTGSDEDISRLPDTCFGITAADDVGYAIGQSLVLEMGGEPFCVREDARILYHAALAHASNHIVTVLADALEALRAALSGGDCSANKPSTTSRAGSWSASSGRWPERRWRTRCSGDRPRSPDRSPAAMRQRSRIIWRPSRTSTQRWPRHTG